MKPEDLINHHAGDITQSAATALVTEQTVRNWIKSGFIPLNRQFTIQARTKGALRAESFANGRSEK